MNFYALDRLRKGQDYKHTLLNGVSAIMLVLTFPSPAHALDANALPSGGNIVGGSAILDYSIDKELHVQQSTDRAVIEWNRFDIGADALMEFHQPSYSSLTVNRVTGDGDPSQILGRMKANGQVMVLDKNGVFFGNGAQINVGSIIVSTGNVSNENALDDDHITIHDIDNNGMIINNGSVTINDAGLAAFVAPTVVNNGIILAKLGRIDVAAGSKATLDLYGDGLVELELDKGLEQRLINTGILQADGGVIRMQAAAAKDIVDNIILNDGLISATTATQDKQGRIILSAEGSGQSTTINSGLINASGFGKDQKGGKVEILGDNVILDHNSLIDASGDAGGGDIKIGGDYLGQGDTRTAKYTYVSPTAYIFNDAISSGNGGRTIVWAGNTTDFYGSIFGRGGVLGGDGGFVETSGKENLLAQGYVDLTAANGNKGTYLLDPANITIYGNFAPNYISTDASLNLSSLLALWYDASSLTGLSNGDAVALLPDLSGHGNDAVQTGGNKPIYVSNGLNGKGVLRFNGSQILETLSPVGITGASARYISALMNSSTSGNRNIVGYGVDGSGNIFDMMVYNTSIIGHFYGGGFDTLGGSPAFTVGSWSTASLNYDGSMVSVYANGAFGNSKSVTLNTTDNNFRIGGGGYASFNYFQGDIAEVFLYSDDLDASTRGLLDQYQSAKWNIGFLNSDPVAEASAAMNATTGYGSFTTRYLERLSATADIVLQASNSITLDLKGDTLSLANDRNISVTTTNGNISDVSAGTIRTNRTGTGGNITLNASGAGSINLATTNLEALGGGSVNLRAGGSIDILQASALNLGAVKGSSVAIRTTGGSSDITGTGSLVSTGGIVAVNAGRDLNLNNFGIYTNNGDIDLDAARDVAINTWVNAGSGGITIDAGRDIAVTRDTSLDSLVGFWNFNEGAGTSAGDRAGTNDGIISGATWTTDTPFGFGYSLDFNGAGNFVNLGNDSVLDLDGTFTISAWAKKDVANQNGVVVSKWSTGAGNNNSYVITNGNDVTDARYTFIVQESDNSPIVFAANAQSTNASEWVNLTAVGDGSFIRLYQNGVEVAVTAYDGTLKATAKNLLIGKLRDEDNIYGFDGKIDDVRLYDTNLSASQVHTLMAPQVDWGGSTASMRAGRDIVLNGGISSTAAGNSLVLSAGRNFINNAGGSALDAGAGRWLVYSTNPANNTLGGLAADFKRYNKTYAGYAPGSVTETGNGLFYSYAPTLTVTAANKTREYGAANPAFTSSITGLIDGDTLSFARSGTPDYSAPAATADVGIGAITPSLGTLTSELGYQFSFVPGTLTITKLTLVLSVDNKTRVSGQPDPEFTSQIIGFKFSDTLADIDTKPVYTTTANASSPAGKYKISSGGAIDNNYNFNYVDGDYTITAAGFDLPSSFLHIASSTPIVDNGTQSQQAQETSELLTQTMIVDYKNAKTSGNSPILFGKSPMILRRMIREGLIEITKEAAEKFDL